MSDPHENQNDLNAPFSETIAADCGNATKKESPQARRADLQGPNGARESTPDIESATDDLLELPTIDPANYKFGSYFARGGMGRIAAVRDRRLGRVVAIKELIGNESGLIDRFKREAYITAQLQHPAIVNVHEAGRWPTGEPFFSMKLVAGTSLKETIKKCSTLDERLSLLPHATAIVDALAYAHDRGVIHRDLKPDNVLIGDYGETVVIDWGLAKDLDEQEIDDPELSLGKVASNHMTIAGAVMGTPSYMAPEQARGEDAGLRTDVYALGAILYTILSGQAPYDGPTSTTVLAKVIENPPLPLSERQPGLPGDLQTIVDKAMARSPVSRYANAGELAAELKRFQTGRLVAAHKYSRRQLFLRWLRRYRAAFVVGSISFALLAVFSIVSVSRIIHERDQARSAKNMATERADSLTLSQAQSLAKSDSQEALSLLRTLPPSSAQWTAARVVAQDAKSNGIPQVLKLSDAKIDEFVVSPRGNQIAAVAGNRVYLLDAAGDGQQIVATHDDRITDVAFSPEGETIATSSNDNNVSLWSLEGNRIRTLSGHQGWVNNVDFDPSGTRLVSASLDRTTRIWDVAIGKSQVIPGWIGAVEFSADGERMVGIDVNDQMRFSVWEAATGTQHSFDDAASKNLHDVAMARSGQFVATAGQDRTVRTWDVSSKSSRILGSHGDEVTAVALSFDDQTLISASRDGDVRVWDLATEKHWSYRGKRTTVRSLVVSVDGRWLASSDGSGLVYLIDLSTKEGRLLPGNQGRPAFTKDGQRLFTQDSEGRVLAWTLGRGDDHRFVTNPGARNAAFSGLSNQVVFPGKGWRLRLWNTVTRESKDLRGHRAQVQYAELSPGGTLAASLDARKTVRLWTTNNGNSVVLPGRAVLMLAFSPDGHQVAAPGDNESVRVWNVESGEMRALTGHRGWVSWVAFAGPKTLVSGGSDGTVRRWDTKTGESEIIGEHKKSVRQVAASSDGRFIASAGEDGMVRLYDDADGISRELAGHQGWIMSISFSPDGTQLVSGGADRAVRIWDTITRASRVFDGHTDTILDVSFSPDGKQVASASIDNDVRVWDARTGVSRVLDSHTAAVRSVRFSSDGNWIATTSRDGSVRFWPDDLPRSPELLQQWFDTVLPKHR